MRLSNRLRGARPLATARAPPRTRPWYPGWTPGAGLVQPPDEDARKPPDEWRVGECGSVLGVFSEREDAMRLAREYGDAVRTVVGYTDGIAVQWWAGTMRA